MRSAAYIQDKSNLKVQVVLLTPKGDKLNSMKWEIPVFQGPEYDVLTRYIGACDHYKPDYLVRITSDCPVIPSGIISKHIFASANYGFDYTTNTAEKCRTYPDGFDVQVMSMRLMKWLDENATHIKYREHVANLLEETRPDWLRMAHVVGYVDNSHLKLSVDEKDDLDFVIMYEDLLQSKMDYAKNNSEVLIRW